MPPPDHRRPFPDEAHEAVASWVEEAIADLGDTFLLLDALFTLHDGAATSIGFNSADLGDVLLLVDVLFGLIDQQRIDHDALAGRVTALEALTAVPPPDAPPPIST